MNSKTIEEIVKKYAESKEYPRLEDEGGAFFADFGIFENVDFDCTIEEIRSELISKLSKTSGLDVNAEFECGLTLYVNFPYPEKNEDSVGYEEILEKLIKETKEILHSHGAPNDFSKSDYDLEQSRRQCDVFSNK